MSLANFFSYIFSLISPTYPLPVYSMAEYGEDVVLLFPNQNIDTFEGARRTLLLPNEVSYGSATLSTGAAPAAVSTFDFTFERLFDMPFWIFGIRPSIVAGLTVGVGDTVDLSCEVIISLLKPDGSIQQLYDHTLSNVGFVADGNNSFSFVGVGMELLVPQHSKLLVRVIITATRTAGANSPTAIFIQNLANDRRSSVFVHAHAHRTHGEIVYGTDKTS